MDKIWFIKLDGNEEGPYSIQDLKYDFRVTPDTLAWREGYKTWQPIRNIVELSVLFEEEPTVKEEEEIKKPKFTSTGPREELAIDFYKDPTFFFVWMIIAAIIIFYFLYELYWR